MIDLDNLFLQLAPLYGGKQVEVWRQGQARMHLALMQGDFLDGLLAGSKKIESRFSRARIAPVGALDVGDLIIFKQVGRPRMAVGTVAKAKSGPLDDKTWKFIRSHADEIGVDDDYLDYKSESRYYALAWMDAVYLIATVNISKRDRRSWVIISPTGN